MKISAICMGLVLALSLSACGGSGGIVEEGPVEHDATTVAIERFLRGQHQATWHVRLHENPSAGQYWETRTEANGVVTRVRWQIVRQDGDDVLVEQHYLSDEAGVITDYVIAYLVNAAADHGDVNVKAAWIGRRREEPQPIEVMSRPEPTSHGDFSQEPFDGLQLAGRRWSGTLYKGEHSSYWVASDGWFDGRVRMEAGGMVTELTAFGGNARPLLRWE
jgi:hypothetical protein